MYVFSFPLLPTLTLSHNLMSDVEFIKFELPGGIRFLASIIVNF
jgi:hypothetical protein